MSKKKRDKDRENMLAALFICRHSLGTVEHLHGNLVALARHQFPENYEDLSTVILGFTEGVAKYRQCLDDMVGELGIQEEQR